MYKEEIKPTKKNIIKNHKIIFQWPRARIHTTQQHDLFDQKWVIRKKKRTNICTLSYNNIQQNSSVFYF